MGTNPVQIPPDTARHSTTPTSTNRHVSAPPRTSALVGHGSSTTGVHPTDDHIAVLDYEMTPLMDRAKADLRAKANFLKNAHVGHASFTNTTILLA